MSGANGAGEPGAEVDDRDLSGIDSYAEGGVAPTHGYQDDAWSRAVVALGAAGMREIPGGRLARMRMVLRGRPWAAVLLVVFLVGFLLTCALPAVPLVRLGYDLADASLRASLLTELARDNPAQLLQPARLRAARADLDNIRRDLFEIDATTNIVAAPLAALSPSVRADRLLVRVGYDLAVAGDEGLQLAQMLLGPLEGGAVSSAADVPGLTTATIAQGRSLLRDAHARVTDALQADRQIDPRALPAILRPGSRYGALLALLPLVPGAIDEMGALLGAAPAMLGIGQPAHYLVIAMDKSELRPGGGFQGNFGILTLLNGKQAQNRPLALYDTYDLDALYYKTHVTANMAYCDPSNPLYYGPQPPSIYWWWPVRNYSCQFDWGLRDSNLSPDFPTNARMAMGILEGSGWLADHGRLQGVVAFTPDLIENLLNVPGVGPIQLPQYPRDPPVTADNLEQMIHCHQLGGAGCDHRGSGDTSDRKQFTHLLAQALEQRLKRLHGSGLDALVRVALQALRSKDLEVYLRDPHAKLLLQKLGLAAQIHTGGGDGFFVVDANEGANKANQYVTEHQQDLVTLLPNGGAVHRLEITVTYNKQGPVYPLAQEDYNEVQRIYMPGNAIILGYIGFSRHPSDWNNFYLPHPISDCSQPATCLDAPTTLSDVSGRTMVMGLLDVACYDDAEGRPIYDLPVQSPNYKGPSCSTPHVNQQIIDVEWYTPHAWTTDGRGHASYTELVEKQSGTSQVNGSADTLSVYVDTSQLRAPQRAIDWTDTILRIGALASAHKAFAGPLETDTVVQFAFNMSDTPG